MKRTILYSLVLTLSACSASHNLSNSGNGRVSPDETALLWQQTAAEYDALCYQAFNAAKFQLDQLLEDKGYEKAPMVVLDLDETVLDNSAYYGKLLLTGEKGNSDTWLDWVNQRKAGFVPGSIDFLRYAQQRDVRIKFISNRNVDNLQATIENFNKSGLNFELINFSLNEETDPSKEKRRLMAEQDGSIIMLIGDNLADFSDVFEKENMNITLRKQEVQRLQESFGINFILVPNLMYGDWKKAFDIEDTKASKNIEPGNRRFIQSY